MCAEPSAYRERVTTWLQRAEPGYCNATQFTDEPFLERTCLHGKSGAWRLSLPQARTWEDALTTCQQRCEMCQGCNFMSVSREERDCSWFRNCDVTNLHRSQPTEKVAQSFRTAPSGKQHLPSSNADVAPMRGIAHKHSRTCLSLGGGFWVPSGPLRTSSLSFLETGDLYQFGVAEGHSLRSLLQIFTKTRAWAFDTYEGMPLPESGEPTFRTTWRRGQFAGSEKLPLLANHLRSRVQVMATMTSTWSAAECH